MGVNAQSLTANFTADKTAGCLPLKVTFTNTTSGAVSDATYKWEFDNGNTSTIPNPSAIFYEERDYNVKLTVTSGGKTSVQTKKITVHKKPSIDFDINIQKGCFPLEVTLSAKQAPENSTIVSYAWDFGDGNTNVNKNAAVKHTYNAAQQPTVSLTITDNFGCYNTLEKPKAVNVLPGIKIDFAADKQVLCKVSDPIQFTNNTTGPGTLDYRWDFGNGNTSTEKAPSYIFNTKGTYTVSLTVNSSEGCTATKTQADYLNIVNYKTDFEVSSSLCQNANIEFKNTGTPQPTKSIWDFGDGQPALTNNDKTVVHNYSVAGKQTVKLTSTFGTCEQTTTHDIVINPAPVLGGYVSYQDMACDKTTLFLQDTVSTAVSWQWANMFGHVFSTEKNASLAYRKGEWYGYENINLTVKDQNGCSSSFKQYVDFQYAKVEIDYHYSYGDEEAITCEKPASATLFVNSNVDIVKYHWDFDDGTTFDGPNPPKHYFPDHRQYDVKLTYTTKQGCVDVVHFGAKNYRKIEGDFTTTEGDFDICGNTPVQFVNTSKDLDETGISWGFGDGGFCSPVPPFNCYVPIHQYQDTGKYEVSLTQWNFGCSVNTVVKTIVVHGPITKITGSTHLCDNNWGTMKFAQSCIDAKSMEWDFGDGTKLTSMAPEVEHTYTASGKYKVILTATNDGCVVKDSVTITVALKTVFNVILDDYNLCKDGSLFYIITVDEETKEYTHFDMVKWQYGDGTDFTGTYGASSYMNYNTMTGTISSFAGGKSNLRAILKQSETGCLDTTAYLPMTFKGPNAMFDIINNSSCMGTTVSFKDKSVATGLPITGLEWNFGDGTTMTGETGKTVSHNYAAPGAYNVTLKVKSDEPCPVTTNGTTQTVKINGPKASFYVSSADVALNSTVTFYNNTNTFGSTNTLYQWSFADGVNSAEISPSHAFITPGKYRVVLHAEDVTTKCASDFSIEINVRDFTYNFTSSSTFVTGTGCPPLLVQFANASQNYTHVRWDFGDGTIIDDLNKPSHIYNNAGTFDIILYVYGDNGLKGTHKETVTIKSPSATIKSNLAEACIGQDVTFNATTLNAQMCTWDFGDGSLVTSPELSFVHAYTRSGDYKAALIVTDDQGCTVLSQPQQHINVHPNPKIEITSAPFVCKGAVIELTAKGGVSYSWSPDDGTLNALNVSNPTASPSVTSTYHLTVADNIGCKNTADYLVKVVQPITVKANNDTAVCIGNNMQFFASGASTYQWINFTEGLSGTTINNPTTTVRNTATYTVKGFDDYGCFTSTANIKVTALDLPTFNAGSDVKVLAGTPVQLNTQSSSDVVQWVWTPDKYLNCNNCAAPVCTPTGQVTYKVTVTNKNKCQASDEITVKLDCEAARVRIPNVFSPNNDGNNDLFIISGIGIIKHLTIFDRWGTKVFERSNFIANDKGSCWDGNRNGMPVPGGTYVYFVEMQCETGEPFAMRGTVVLIR